LILGREGLKTGIYIRVSTEEQVNEGYSIEAQKNKLLQYCQVHNYEVIDIYIDEGISGKSLNRPRVQDLLVDVRQKQIENVLVYKLDRITRSLKDLIMLVDFFEKYQVHFTSFTEKIDTSSSNGRMFLQLMGVLAEWERNVIGERVVVGMEQRAKEGKYSAPGNPFGYIYENGVYRIKEEEAVLIRNIFSLHQEGKGYTTIAKHLNSLGFRTKNHAPWTSKAVWMIVNRPYYSGFFHYKNNQTLIKATNIEPIISLEKWEMSQRISLSRNFKHSKKYSRDEFIFHQKLRCSCGRLMGTNIAKSKKADKLYFYYSCVMKKEGLCTQGYINVAKIEKQFIECLTQAIPKTLKYILSLHTNEIPTEQKQLTSIIALLKKEEERKNKLHLSYLDDIFDEKTYQELLSEIQLRIKELHKQNEEIENEIKYITLKSSQEILVGENIIELWKALSLIEKKEFIKLFIKKIVINKDCITEIEFNMMEGTNDGKMQTD
jgi:site-specific DNA recombinase